MIIDRLGEASPLLGEMLEVLGATVEDGKLVIPADIRITQDGLEVCVKAHYSRFHHGKWKAPIVDRDRAIAAGREVAEDGSII